MTPVSLIADLDKALQESGETIRLQRLTLGPGGVQTPVEVTCRARVRGAGVADVVGGLTRPLSDVVISSTEINEQGWPGPATSPEAGIADIRIPVRTDRCFVKGRPVTILSVDPIYVADVLVRINMRVSG